MYLLYHFLLNILNYSVILLPLALGRVGEIHKGEKECKMQRALLFLIVIISILSLLLIPKVTLSKDIQVTATVLETISIIEKNGNIYIETNHKSGVWRINKGHYLFIVAKI